MERMETYPEMELVFAAVLHHVLVGTDAASLQSLTGQLLVLVRDQVNTKRKVVNGSLLSTKIIDPNLGIWTREKQRAGFTIMFLSPSHIPAAGWHSSCWVGVLNLYVQIQLGVCLAAQNIRGGLTVVTVRHHPPCVYPCLPYVTCVAKNLPSLPLCICILCKVSKTGGGKGLGTGWLGATPPSQILSETQHYTGQW